MISKTGKNYIIIALLLIPPGFFLAISTAFVLCIALTLFLGLYMINNTADEDRGYILSIIVLSLAIRIAVISVLQYLSFTQGRLDIFGDANDNITRGMGVADFLRGLTHRKLEYGDYNTHGLTFFNGLFFALFNEDVFSLKYLNSFSIVAAAWLIYDLTRRVYSRSAGKLAMTIILFWPTLFIWSVTDLKESHVIVVSVIIIWCVERIISAEKNSRRLFFIFLMAVFSLYFVFLKLKANSFILGSSFSVVLFYFIFKIRPKEKIDKGIMALTLLTRYFIVLFLFIFRKAIFQAAISFYDVSIGMNRGYLASGGFNYNLFGNETNFYTLKFFLKFFSGAWLHFLLEPLPWHIYSLSLALVFPLMLIWYFLLFECIMGIMRIKKNGNMGRISFMLVFLAVYITAIGTSLANIGTTVRLRDAIMPLVVMLASCGIVKASGPQEDAHLNYSLNPKLR